ncbi:MAG: hypothetical protein HWE16_02270 [Gammaproteobacteria bacterium]|nr:hypothetical protein [Gammaproteobacteria bacterium]
MSRQHIKTPMALIVLNMALLGLNQAAMASETLTLDSPTFEPVVMEQIGHLSFAQNNKNQRQVASATTIISKIYRNKAEISVSQSFANNSEQTMAAEYFFPLPYNGRLLGFEMNTDYLAQDEMPDTTVTLQKDDQLQVTFAYELVDDSPYHASVMGFPAKPNLPMVQINQDELVAKK